MNFKYVNCIYSGLCFYDNPQVLVFYNRLYSVDWELCSTASHSGTQSDGATIILKPFTVAEGKVAVEAIMLTNKCCGPIE